MIYLIQGLFPELFFFTFIFHVPFHLTQIRTMKVKLCMYILQSHLQIQKSSKVYRRLSEVLGLSDESMVLSVFIRKM
jgi:hypothetical protein